MFQLLKEKIKEYFERNEMAHAHYAANADLTEEEKIYANSIPGLPEEIVDELDQEPKGELHILEVQDDDITPMVYVIQVITKFSRRDRPQSIDLMLKIHSKGSGQILTGEKELMEKVAMHIELDARSRKFPLKLSVTKA